MAGKNGKLDLITAVVRRTLADVSLKAAIDAGATGVTHFPAEGTGVRQKLGYAGTLIEAEKQVLWIVTPKAETKKVLSAVVAAANLSLPGEGFAFVEEVTEAIGFVTK